MCQNHITIYFDHRSQRINIKSKQHCDIKHKKNTLTINMEQNVSKKVIFKKSNFLYIVQNRKQNKLVKKKVQFKICFLNSINKSLDYLI